MELPGVVDPRDPYSWWTDLITDELRDCAEVRRETGAAAGMSIVTITPFREDALPLRIVAGDTSVPEIEFGTGRPFACVGVAPTPDAGGLDPSNHLGVMVAAVITDGAVLVRSTFARRTLALGHGARLAEVADSPVLRRWAPYADEYVLSTVFRRPPEYDVLPPRAFLVPGAGVRA